MANIPTSTNNPGDLKDPSTGTFRKFNDPGQGYEALLNDLQTKINRNPNTNLVDFSSVYAPASDNNNPAEYAANLANRLKVRPDATLGSLQPRIGELAQAIGHNEGFQAPDNGLGAFNTQAKPETQVQTPQDSQDQPDTSQNQDKGFFGNLMSGNLIGAGKNALNFAFPIVGDIKHDIEGTNKKSLLQQAGDLGLSGLWFIPGLGEGGLMATALKGAALGYGAGALSNLSQGQDIGKAVSPQLSNLVGAATGGVAGAILPKISGFLSKQFTEGGALRAVEDNLGSELTRTIPGKTLVGNLPEKGSRALRLIAQSGAIPEVSGNNFIVNDAIDKLDSRIGQLGQARAAAIEKFAPATSLDELAVQAKSGISNITEGASDAEKHLTQQKMFSGEVGKMNSKIDSIIADIKATTGKTELTAPELEAFKEIQTKNSKIFKRTGAIGEENAASLLGGVAKKKMETLANDAGFPGMKEYNQYISDHYDAISLLERLGKQTIKGGRLGNMLKQHTMGLAGSMAGSAMGGGFLGSIGGLIAGESAGNFLNRIIGDTSVSNPLRDVILSKISQEDPRIVQELMQFAGKTGQIAPRAVPKVAGRIRGLIPSTLIKGAAIGGSSAAGLLNQAIPQLPTQ